MGRATRGRGETEEVRARQAAAAFLRAARLTDDPVERESLRRRAAALLAPVEEDTRPGPAPVRARSQVKA
jgi:hypothetical protein